MSENQAGPDNPQGSAPPPTAGGRRRTHRVWWLLLALVVLAAAWFFYRHEAAKNRRPAAAPPPIQVETATATNGDIGVYVSALGLVTPLNVVTLTSLATGQLLRVNYAEGALVKEGDLLVEIDPRANQAQVTTAEGQLARDQALLQQTRIDLERFKAAYASNAIPKQQLDDQQALLYQNEGTVKLDQGQLENARVLLTYCLITSPISGRVGLRLLDPGNTIVANVSNALVVVTQLQPITIIYSVAEDYLPQIQQQLAQGHHMGVEAYDRAQQHLLATGELSAVDNQIDVTTGTIRLRAQFTNADYALFPNQFVNVKHLITTLRGVVLLPSSAIQRGVQGAFVYVVRPDHTTVMRTVTAGVTEGNVTAVEGVQPGEVVANSNFNRLREGAPVNARPPPPPRGTNQQAGP